MNANGNRKRDDIKPPQRRAAPPFGRTMRGIISINLTLSRAKQNTNRGGRRVTLIIACAQADQKSRKSRSPIESGS